MIARTVFLTLLGFFVGMPLLVHAVDPAHAEDAAIERQRILRATDQIEILTKQVAELQMELQKIRENIEQLRTENYKLKQKLEISETRRTKEKEALLAEVAKSIARVSKRKAEEAATAAVAQAKREQGYEHIVASGDTLWAIARAYRDQGVNVTVDGILKANGLKKGSILRVGQKLFIPKK